MQNCVLYYLDYKCFTLQLRFTLLGYSRKPCKGKGFAYSLPLQGMEYAKLCTGFATTF